jgi:propanol-preferring alcohol dehydrogenase
MKAFRLIEPQRPPELVDVPTPEPGPGEVLVKIGGAGACHSDLHLMEYSAEQLPGETPFTLGHENAGWVAATGLGTDGGMAEYLLVPDRRLLVSLGDMDPARPRP